MLLLLLKHLWPWLKDSGLGAFRVFFSSTFRSILCIPLAFVIILLFGRPFIAWLTRQKIGDNPSFDQDDINDRNAYKKNTPTMGGMLIIAAIAGSILLMADLENFYVRMALLCAIYLGALGGVDDWLKLTKHRRGEKDRQGLRSIEKLAFQVGLGAIIGFFTYRYGQNVASNHTLYFPFFKNAAIPLGMSVFIILSTIVLTGSSNAVNLTDGMDGLAAGCMSIVSFTFFIFAVIVGAQNIEISDRPITEFLFLPRVEGADEMAVVAAAMCGACVGFLWFNCYPAKVFMGDTGSLALGGLIGYVSIVIRQEILLLLVGGVFAAEAVSVMLQVSYFKYTRRRYGQGRRIFLMSPLHHHFQKKKMEESTIVVRFWIVTAMLAALTLATVKLR